MDNKPEIKFWKSRDVVKQLIHETGTAAALAEDLRIDDTQLSKVMAGERGLTFPCYDVVLERGGKVIVDKADIESLLKEIENLESLFSGASIYWAKERARNGK